MVRNFKSPVNVAPFIRATRWSMLIGGIIYGAYNQKVLQDYEKTNSDNRLKMQKERDEGIRKLKKCGSEESSAARNVDQKSTS